MAPSQFRDVSAFSNLHVNMVWDVFAVGPKLGYYRFTWAMFRRVPGNKTPLQGAPPRHKFWNFSPEDPPKPPPLIFPEKNQEFQNFAPPPQKNNSSREKFRKNLKFHFYSHFIAKTIFPEKGFWKSEKFWKERGREIDR